MSVLVTGGSGSIGRHIVPHLMASGHEVELFIEPSDAAGLDWARRKELKVHRGDIRDADAVQRAVHRAAVVVHLAGVAGVRASDEVSMHDINVTGARSISEACLRGGQRLIHVSSASAVGLSPKAQPIEEDFEFGRSGIDHPYPVSKRRGQDVVADAIREGLDGIILNPGAALLPGDPRAHAWSALPRLLRDGLRWVPPGGFGFVGRRTLMAAVDSAMICRRSPEPTLVLDQSTSYAAVFQMMAELMGLRAPRTVPTTLTKVALSAIGMARLAGWSGVDVDSRVSPLATWPNVYGGARSRERLGIGQRPLREAVTELVVST